MIRRFVWAALSISAPVLALAPARLEAQQKPAPDVSAFLIADRSREIGLARSAAPSFISDSATVLVLDRTGYVEAIHGTNGFTCVVIRSLGGGLSLPWLWDPRITAPHCFNPPAARTVMPVMLRQTEWLLSGETASQVAAHIERAYARHEFSPPADGAMAYMLSPEQILTDSGSHWMPHLMFFYEKTRSPALFGARATDAPVLDGSAGDPHAPFLSLFIPVTKWSRE